MKTPPMTRQPKEVSEALERTELKALGQRNEPSSTEIRSLMKLFIGGDLSRSEHL
jgi:hypothetical protein